MYTHTRSLRPTRRGRRRAGRRGQQRHHEHQTREACVRFAQRLFERCVSGCVFVWLCVGGGNTGGQHRAAEGGYPIHLPTPIHPQTNPTTHGRLRLASDAAGQRAEHGTGEAAGDHGDGGGGAAGMGVCVSFGRRS